MNHTIRWGILGTGSIARTFAQGLASVPEASLVAVGSRTAASASAFAAANNVPRHHGDYAALAADPGIDAVYIATPHVMHRDNTLMLLSAGKAVLCEKPFAMNAREAQAMADAARRNRRFCMEAMWTRFLPVWVRVRELIASGAIGEPRLLSADFGFRCGWDPASRLLDLRLGGGALLDVGVYVVALAHQVFGAAPADVQASAHIGATGVDEQTALALRWAGGQIASLTCAVRTNTPHEARICGTEGEIRVPDFWRANRFTLVRGGTPEIIEAPFAGNGYGHEAAEVGRCLRAGLHESPVMTLDESVAIARTIDAARAHIGLRYDTDVGPAATTTSDT